jgi:hypothetical protein
MLNSPLARLLAAVLNVAWYGVALGLALSACFLLASPFMDLTNAEMTLPISVKVDAQLHPVTAPSISSAPAEFEDLNGILRFQPRRGALIGVLIPLTLFLAVLLWVVSQLRALFRSLRDGHPFVPENATRVRRIGYAVIAGELLRAAFIFIASRYAATNFMAEGLEFDTRPDLNVIAIIHGLIILAIGEVFRAGTRLDEDHSLTI